MMKKQILQLIMFSVIAFLGMNVKAQTTHTVTNLDDAGTGSLRQAVIDANSTDTIRFNPTLIANGDATIILASAILFSKSLTIKGLYNHSYSLMISGNNANGIFEISNTGNVYLDSVVLTNGNRPSGTGYGGAISFVSSDTLFVTNSTIKDSEAFDGGGGIFTSSVVKVENSTMSNNGGQYGGAILTKSVEASVLIKSSTINDNNALNGGAIATDALSIPSSTVTFTIEESTIVNNMAINYGGLFARVQDDANINITNSTIWGNTGTGANCAYINSNGNSNVFIQNNILWQSTGAPITATNLVITSAHNIFNNVPAFASGTDNINISNVNLGVLDFNGGTTQTKAPLSVSVAINNGYPFDMSDAQNRPVINTRDIGAAEYNCSVSPLNETKEACETYTWKNGVTYTSSTSGVTYKKLNVAAGACDSIYVLNLTINQPNSGDTTAIACESFNWYGTDYTTSGTPTHILTNTNGCDSIVTLNLTINTVDLTTTQTDEVNLMASAMGASYQWLDCDNSNAPITGETNQSFIATADGNYAVEVTENGCTDTSACINVSTLSLDNLSDKNDVKIYPNPSQGNFYIEFDSFGTDNYTATLYNTVGALVYTQVINQKRTEISTNNLSSGVYLLHIHNKETKRVYRLVIE